MRVTRYLIKAVTVSELLQIAEQLQNITVNGQPVFLVEVDERGPYRKATVLANFTTGEFEWKRKEEHHV